MFFVVDAAKKKSSARNSDKSDKFDNFFSMKILNTPLAKKSDGIRNKRPGQRVGRTMQKIRRGAPCTILHPQAWYSVP